MNLRKKIYYYDEIMISMSYLIAGTGIKNISWLDTIRIRENKIATIKIKLNRSQRIKCWISCFFSCSFQQT